MAPSRVHVAPSCVHVAQFGAIEREVALLGALCPFELNPRRRLKLHEKRAELLSPPLALLNERSYAQIVRQVRHVYATCTPRVRGLGAVAMSADAFYSCTYRSNMCHQGLFDVASIRSEQLEIVSSLCANLPAEARTAPLTPHVEKAVRAYSLIPHSLPPLSPPLPASCSHVII